MSRTLAVLMFPLAIGAFVHAPATAAAGCGEVVMIKTHHGTTTRYALALPKPPPPGGVRVTVVLLAGGGGHLDLDDQGCPRNLTGNSLVRSVPHFHHAGYATALVDAPSDFMDEDGLGGFRVKAAHAEDLGKVIADVRRRAKTVVWLAGSSRGSISVVNAAARLSGSSAPDGLVLQSALTSGYVGGQKAWVADTVFDLPLEAIRMPVLVVGHTEDKCIRTPPARMPEIIARTSSDREQVVTVTGGPGWPGGVSVKACAGRAPHGFAQQEAEVTAGVARFIEGGRY